MNIFIAWNSKDIKFIFLVVRPAPPPTPLTCSPAMQCNVIGGCIFMSEVLKKIESSPFTLSTFMVLKWECGSDEAGGPLKALVALNTHCLVKCMTICPPENCQWQKTKSRVIKFWPIGFYKLSQDLLCRGRSCRQWPYPFFVFILAFEAQTNPARQQVWHITNGSRRTCHLNPSMQPKELPRSRPFY